MNEILTIEEIYKRFPSEWVLIGNPDTDESLAVRKGEVLWHGKDRDEVYRKGIELRPPRSACVYTGPIPAPGTVLVL